MNTSLRCPSLVSGIVITKVFVPLDCCILGLVRVWRSVACLLLLRGAFSWFLYLSSFTISLALFLLINCWVVVKPHLELRLSNMSRKNVYFAKVMVHKNISNDIYNENEFCGQVKCEEVLFVHYLCILVNRQFAVTNLLTCSLAHNFKWNSNKSY